MKSISVLILSMMTFAASARAASVALRSDYSASGAVVTLGDVAEITSQDTEIVARLRSVELMPAPPAGAKRTLRVREIQDLLELRGVRLVEHRFSGASSVTITGAAPAAASKPVQITTNMSRAAEKTLRDAILQHLQETASADEPWDLTVQPSDDVVRSVSVATGPIRITGGAPPWTGPQTFTVVCQGPTGAVQLNVAAKVTLPPAVVVTTRNLPKGALLRAGDVKVQRAADRTVRGDVLQRVEDVLGRETNRALSEGQPLENSFVRLPILVKKGEVVTVYARTGGVQVRTTARAKDEGAQGDVVTVESLLDKKAFLARVTAPQEVEVFAKGITAMSEPEVEAPPIARRNPITR